VKRRRLYAWSPRAWAVEFRRLHDSFQPTGAEAAGRLTTVLSWYVEHIGEQYVPQAFSAESFRVKFDAIEEAMKRHTRDNPDVVPGADALEISERLLMRGWPKGAEAHVPAVVQMCLDFMNSWTDRLYRVDTGNARLDRFAQELRRHDLGDPYHYTENWMGGVHRQVRKWADWSGRLTNFVIGPDSKKFNQDGRAAADEICGDAGAWDGLQRVIAGL
jgi:hypothetical protein